MIDVSFVMETAARDPLIVAFGLMVLGGLTTHFLFKHSPFTRAIVRVVCLILLTILLLSAGIVPYRPLHSTGSRWIWSLSGLPRVIRRTSGNVRNVTVIESPGSISEIVLLLVIARGPPTIERFRYHCDPGSTLGRSP